LTYITFNYFLILKLGIWGSKLANLLTSFYIESLTILAEKKHFDKIMQGVDFVIAKRNALIISSIDIKIISADVSRLIG
jgi:hypothetical protein